MRLSAATLDRLPAAIARPGYDRDAVRGGVVHLGIGAFHRAHQAAVFDAVLASGDMRWGVTGVSLRSGGVRDRLAPQDGLYTLVERSERQAAARVIGAVRDVIVAPEAPARPIAALASPEVHLVTLTITEKGYGAAASAGAGAAPDAADYILAGLAARRAAGVAPFTAISCDNLPDNGARLRAAVLARAHDAGLADWIADRAAFPQTMVDRIVPATTDEDIADHACRTGVLDRALVKTEPFLQWVVEDRFAGPRPDLEAFGVRIAASVTPWEEAKLRLLNGAHSAIAYLGGLAGIATVDRFVADGAGRRFVEALWDEAETTLDPPAGFDAAAYRGALMARFANPTLAHATRQIAIDGSQKIPQRLVAPLRARRAAGLPADALALALAAWMRWQSGRTDDGTAFAVDDPLADRTAAAIAGASDAAGRVRALLGIAAIFPEACATDAGLIATLAERLDALERLGAARVLGLRQG